MYSSRMNRMMIVWLPLLLPLLLLQLELRPAEARCEMPDMPENGYVNRFRAAVRYRCNAGYHLIGQASLICSVRGRISGQRPFCAKRGCTQPASPSMGSIAVQSGMVATLSCEEPYVVAGNGQAYCNGRNWDRDLGSCRHGNYSHDDICDFETEDMCGWSPIYTYDQPWKRVATASHVHSYRTGPRHDHTFQHAYGGHYMLMETIGPGMSGEHHLVSPIYRRELSLKTACCFKFHYFMYGSGVGNMTVSVKPKNVRLDQMWKTQQSRQQYIKWSATGNQGNQWLEHTISIDEMPDDFQVIFTTSDSTSHLGDIAVDDVRLMTGKLCGDRFRTTTAAYTIEPVVFSTTDPPVFDLMNCTNRCDVPAQPEHTQRLVEYCGCDWSCTDQGNCCPDFLSTCYPGTGETAAATTTPWPTTTWTPPRTTTTTTTTTTTRRPPPTTTTTTTRRTSTASTTTTTRRTTQTTQTTRATTTTTTASTARPTAAATHRPRTNMSWKVRPDDLMGDIDRPAGPNPGRAMWLLLVAVVLVVAASSVAYRWRRSRATITEKAVSFQNSLARMKKKALLAAASRRGDSEADAVLVADTDSDDGRDVQFEEMGVDIRDVSEL